MYKHQLAEGIQCTDVLGKIVCVGRNYADHAKELNNSIPKQPILFIKPATSAVNMAEPIVIPKDQGSCHHELELAVLIGKRLKNANAEQVKAAIAGIGLAFDLTLRDMQNQLKEKAQPWERAKAFDGACPLSQFVPLAEVDLQNIDLELKRNGDIQQSGNTSAMLFPVINLLIEISQSFSLLPGDVVLTGTPAGVGSLNAGDLLLATLSFNHTLLIEVETTVF